MSPVRAVAGENCHALDLIREGWRGRATLAFVPTNSYAELALRADEILGPRERDTFTRLEYQRRKTSYLLGRYAAKVAIARLVPLTRLSDVDIIAGCFQQPVVRAALAAPIGVSISHAERAACATAFPDEHPMGIDTEAIDAARVDVMKTQFVDRELAAVEALGDRATMSTVIWTAKEALSKVLRCGMTVPFELLEVDTIDRRGDAVSGVFRQFGQYRFESWIRDGVVVSLVLPRKTELGLGPTFLR